YPGLERPALAGVDDHPHLRVLVQLLPGDGELVAHLGVHGVELVRAVVDQPADRPMALDLEIAVPAHTYKVITYGVSSGAVRGGGWPRWSAGSPGTRRRRWPPATTGTGAARPAGRRGAVRRRGR